MVLLGKFGRVCSLRFHIGRVRIDHLIGIFPLADQLQSVPILQEDALNPSADFRESLDDGLHTQCLDRHGIPGSAIAAVLTQQERRRPNHIKQLCPIIQHLQQLFRLFLREAGAVLKDQLFLLDVFEVVRLMCRNIPV